MYFHRVTEINKPKIYRDFIDSLVDNCHSGQGQIEPDIVRDGVWNRNEPRDLDEHQNDLNELLKRLNSKDREVLATQLEKSFEGGVFETLKILEEFEIEPFKEGYEGSPVHEFIGRVDKEGMWEWPEEK